MFKAFRNRERRNVAQSGLSSIFSEDLFQSALEGRQLDEDQHGLERLRGHGAPAHVVGRATWSVERSEKVLGLALW